MTVAETAVDQGVIYNLFQRDLFLAGLTAKSDKICLDMSLLQFNNDFAYQIGGNPDLALDGFFHLKEEQLGGQFGNAINFFTTVAHGLVDERISYQDAFEEALSNARSLVAEHPLAESVKKEERVLKWTNEWDLQSPNGFSIGKMLDNALDSSQAEDFEYPRFEVNKENFKTLKNARETGYTGTFVEFSPSPAISPEAIKRGYLGNSCIFFYEYDPDTKQETVTQRWLRADWFDFEKFIREELERPIGKNADDVIIMQASGFFSEDEALKIKQEFIDKHNGRIMDNSGKLQRYVDGNLSNFLACKLGPILFNGAGRLINGDDMHKQMSKFIEVLTYAQFRLRNKIAQLSGLSTIHPSMELAVYSDDEISDLDSNPDALIVFMESNREQLKLVGCGVNTYEDTYNASGSIYGSFDGMTAEVFMGGNESFGSGEDFPCPDCGKMLGKNERKSGECNGCGLTKQELSDRTGVECG